MIEGLDFLRLDEELFNGLSIFIGVAQLGVIAIAVISLSQQRQQLIRLEEQVLLQRRTVFTSTYSFFFERYSDHLARIPEPDAPKERVEWWWAHFWGFMTSEIHFCQMGLLDPLSTSAWMTQLANDYFEPPRGAPHLESYSEAARRFYSKDNFVGTESARFFDEMREVASIEDARARRAAVRVLIARIYDSVGADFSGTLPR